jgi:DNA-binding transcriptional MerR regulator
MATLTVRELAEKIQRPGEDLTVAVDRLRNWTKEGLIRPTGARHPGTGRKRQYPSSAIIDAQLLQWLTETIGMPAVKAAPMLRDAKERIAEAQKGDWLVISKAEGKKEWQLSNIRRDKLDLFIRTHPEYDTHIVKRIDRDD